MSSDIDGGTFVGNLARAPYTQVDHRLINDGWVARMGASAWAVYSALLQRANEDGACWPSQRRVSADLGISRATVGKSLDTLESLGLIKRDHRTDRSGASTSDWIVIQPLPTRPTTGHPVQNLDTPGLDSRHPRSKIQTVTNTSELTPMNHDIPSREEANDEPGDVDVPKVRVTTATPEQTNPRIADALQDGKPPAHLIPSDWQPSETVRAQIRAQLGVTDDAMAAEVPTFVKWFQRKKERRPGWDRSFYGWCKNLSRDLGLIPDARRQKPTPPKPARGTKIDSAATLHDVVVFGSGPGGERRKAVAARIEASRRRNARSNAYQHEPLTDGEMVQEIKRRGEWGDD